METHLEKDLKNQSLTVDSVNSGKTLDGLSPNSSDQAWKTDEMVKNGEFPVEEDSRRVIEEDENNVVVEDLGLDSDWADSLIIDNGPSSSSIDWGTMPLNVKPLISIMPGEEQNLPQPIISVMPLKKQAFKLGAGLGNLGNTCFLNAVMQSFIHTVPLLQLLASSDHASPCARYMTGFCVICAIRELVDLSLASGGSSVSPSRLVDNLSYFSSNFSRYQQEDAHEFLQCFLDRLERCCVDSIPKDRAPSESDNIVKQVFGGRLVSKLRCCNCGHCSDTYEPLIDLSLEIKNVDSLPAALESFTRVEKIDESEITFTCQNCKTLVSIEKQFMLDRAPSIAVLHLKRFENAGFLVEKVDKHVPFPRELDLLPYTDNSRNNNEEMKYDLYAIIVHAGRSSCSGHYYSFIRSAENDWYKFDDSEVCWVHEDLVLSEDAYIMFYAKRGIPWFSDFVETRKPFFNPSILNTSPKSILDNLDAICSTSPCITESKSSSSDSDSSCYAYEESSKPELDKIKDSESNGTVLTSNPEPAVADKATQDVDVTQRTISLVSKTPSRYPIPEIDQYDSSGNDPAIPHDAITLADLVSSGKQSETDVDQDSERKEVCSLIKKRILGSSGQELMSALHVSESESDLNMKKRKTEVSPSKDDTGSADHHSSDLDTAMASNTR